MKRIKHRIYVGGPFTFKYSEVTPELIRSDFRYGIVGEPFIEQHNDIEDLGNVEYTGPFYYYKKGLNSEAVVESEVEAIRRSDIVFLVSRRRSTSASRYSMSPPRNRPKKTCLRITSPLRFITNTGTRSTKRVLSTRTSPSTSATVPNTPRTGAQPLSKQSNKGQKQ